MTPHCNPKELLNLHCTKPHRASSLLAHLFRQPRDVLDLLAAPRRVAGGQHGVELGQDLREESHDVGVDGHEPGVRRGGVLAAEDQGVPAVRRVQLYQPAQGGKEGRKGRMNLVGRLPEEMVWTAKRQQESDFYQMPPLVHLSQYRLCWW